MATVELVYASDCPNVVSARTNLMRAFTAAQMEPRWREWDSGSTETPQHVRGLGSPTILVNGKDVAPIEPRGGATCRLYRTADGEIRGAPSVDMIRAVLADVRMNDKGPAWSKRGWSLSLATVPAIGAAFLPKVACPACWPAYAGFLGSIGLGFLLNATYLLPLTAIFLATAVGALAFRAKRRRGYWPFVLGVGASVIVLAGKFHYESDAAMYTGLLILVGTSVWNTWPGKSTHQRGCSACGADGPQPQTKNSEVKYELQKED